MVGVFYFEKINYLLITKIKFMELQTIIFIAFGAICLWMLLNPLTKKKTFKTPTIPSPTPTSSLPVEVGEPTTPPTSPSLTIPIIEPEPIDLPPAPPACLKYNIKFEGEVPRAPIEISFVNCKGVSQITHLTTENIEIDICAWKDTVISIDGIQITEVEDCFNLE